MITRYSVVQYVPNPLADERINIGVIAWDEQEMSCKFLSNWKRVQSFGHEDIGYVREFVAKTSSALDRNASPDLFGNSPGLDVSQLEKMIGTWHHSIQFTPPRTSVKNPQSLIQDLTPMFLPAPLEHQVPRSRRTAAKIAAKRLQNAIAQRDPRYVSKILKTNLSLKGACSSHELPVALANGHLLAGVETLSFEIKEHKTLELEFDAVCWTCVDVKEKHRKAQLAVFALGPKRKSELFQKAGKVLRKLEVAFITEGTLGPWADKQAALVVPLAKRLIDEAPRRRAG
jgi:DUF3037 family protein